MCGDSMRSLRSLALYGVRVSNNGACWAFLGIIMTVCSLVPSRIGIITSRLM